MSTLDAHLLQLYLAEKISYTEVITKAQDPDSIAEKIKSMK